MSVCTQTKKLNHFNVPKLPFTESIFTQDLLEISYWKFHTFFDELFLEISEILNWNSPNIFECKNTITSGVSNLGVALCLRNGKLGFPIGAINSIHTKLLKATDEEGTMIHQAVSQKKKKTKTKCNIFNRMILITSNYTYYNPFFVNCLLVVSIMLWIFWIFVF